MGNELDISKFEEKEESLKHVPQYYISEQLIANLHDANTQLQQLECWQEQYTSLESAAVKLRDELQKCTKLDVTTLRINELCKLQADVKLLTCTTLYNAPEGITFKNVDGSNEIIGKYIGDEHDDNTESKENETYSSSDGDDDDNKESKENET
eukprot:244661_1